MKVKFELEGLRVMMQEEKAMLKCEGQEGVAFYVKITNSWHCVRFSEDARQWMPAVDGGFFHRLDKAYDDEVSKQLSDLIMS